MLGQYAPGNGQGNARAVSLEQRSVELQFELPDLRADGGLRTVARLRRLREALEAHNLKERMKLIKIHGAKSAIARVKPVLPGWCGALVKLYQFCRNWRACLIHLLQYLGPGRQLEYFLRQRLVDLHFA